MASIQSATIIMDRPQGGNARKVKYRFEIIDDLGGVTVREVGPKNIPDGFDTAADMAAHASVLLAKETEKEVSEYKQEILAGRNPFQDRTPRFNTRESLLLGILSEAFTLPADDPLVIKGVALLDLVTDAEIKALFGFTDAQVADVRAKAQSLKTAAAEIQAYQPVLGGA